MNGSLFHTRAEEVQHARIGPLPDEPAFPKLAGRTKPFDSVRPKPQSPICGVTVSSSWHEPVACAYPPDHEGQHSWASIPALPPGKSRMTKKEAGIRLAIIAAEIRLTLDESDDDCPSWPDDLGRIASLLHPGGGE